jgi:DNA helicase-2/ATP-dependent DNA helicase PcrA
MKELNREQYRASRPDRGVSLVLAGAGTGKTRTLVEKVGNVINGLPLDPAQVLVLTFSRKAAEELRSRIAALTGGANIHASTFHAFCLDLVLGHWDRFRGALRFAGPPSVIDEDTRLRIIRELVHRDLERFLGVPGDVVVRLLLGPRRPDPRKEDKLKSSGLGAELAALAKRYVERKRELNAIDYDDMIGLAIGLLENDPAVRAAVLERYRYVFVDEFQDVSDDNVRLLGLVLPDRGGNLFAVGDDWQSIYGFRNARVEYIVRMKRYFPGAEVRRLTVNYRSRREIVSLSGRFIRRNRFRTRKGLAAHRGRGGRVVRLVVAGIEEEAALIHGIVGEKKAGVTLAVLFRNNWQCRYLRERLRPAAEEQGVSVMTMHASKGLEFDTVVVAGISDGIIPDPESGLEEERRLLYVACTRAREELVIIAHAGERGGVARFGRELGVVGKNN